MADPITVTLPGGVPIPIPLPPGFPTLTPEQLATVEKEILQQINTGYPTAQKDFQAAVASGDFTKFNADITYFTNEVLKDFEQFAPVVCFTSGTMIRTDRGEVRVEDLLVGDMVVTASGLRPVTWTGSNIVNFNHPRWSKDQPVVIRKDAFAENVPYQDLTVSPGHGVKLDILGEMLTPVGSLVNGMTIVQLEVAQVVYWHVELEMHDIIVSNGLESESYIDVGNRSFFLGEGATHGKDKTLADYCRPFRDGGVLVQAARASLHNRAVVLGFHHEKIAEAA